MVLERILGAWPSEFEAMVAESLLSEDAKKEYLRIFRDRLAMFRLM